MSVCMCVSMCECVDVCHHVCVHTRVRVCVRTHGVTHTQRRPLTHASSPTFTRTTRQQFITFSCTLLQTMFLHKHIHNLSIVRLSAFVPLSLQL